MIGLDLVGSAVDSCTRPLHGMESPQLENPGLHATLLGYEHQTGCAAASEPAS